MVLRIPEANHNMRHYFELFVSPAGPFPMPQPAIAIAAAVADQPFTQSLSVERNLVLVVRHYVLGGTFSSWRPDVTLWLFVDPDREP
jgi:hypothetical protein